MLASFVKDFANDPDVVVLALPRGGVPVAYEIARALSAPLGVLLVRKLGLPGHEELAIGAIASGGTVFFDQKLINQLNLKHASIQSIIKKEQKELERRESLYLNEAPFPDIKSKIVILVDDGIATGSTIKAAIEALRTHQPKSIIVAVPVAAYSTCQEIEPLVEQLVCPIKPIDFDSVSLWYEHFPQVSDNEVMLLLRKLRTTFEVKLDPKSSYSQP